MRVVLERGNVKLTFGRSMILSRLEAKPLDYDGDFPTFSRADMIPKVRHIEIEGYIVSTADTPAGRARDVEKRRRDLAKLISPGDGFFIRIGDKYANLINGTLSFVREAPFSGDESEKFLLKAVISGGFFHKSITTASVIRLSDGLYLPGYVNDSTVGVYNNGCNVIANNRGDVSVGFRAEFTPQSSTSRFSLVETGTYQYISCNYNFRLGDRIIISTHRDDLKFAVRRNGVETNLTGYADEGAQLFLIPPRDCILSVGDGAVFKGSVTFTDSYITF